MVKKEKEVKRGKKEEYIAGNIRERKRKRNRNI